MISHRAMRNYLTKTIGKGESLHCTTLCIFIAIFLFTPATADGTEVLSPPYTGAVTSTNAETVDLTIGDVGYASSIDTETGLIVQYGVAQAFISMGTGVSVSNSMNGVFSVPVSGEYTIELSGNITRILTAVGKTFTYGSFQKGVFNIEINGGVTGHPLTTDIIYETELGVTEYLTEASWTSILATLESAPIVGNGLKIGAQVIATALEIHDAIPQAEIMEPFSLSVTVPLSAGTHHWWFDIRSKTIASAFGAAGMYASSIISCNLEAITVTPSVPNYIITTSSGSNGVIDPESDVYVSTGSSKTFKALPDNGFLVDRWEKDGVTVQAGGNTFTMENVQSDTALSVFFKDIDFEASNDSWGQATDLGQISADEGFDYNVNITPGDVDYYQFEIIATGTSDDSVGIWITNDAYSGRGSYDIDLVLGELDHGQLVPADGETYWLKSMSQTETRNEEVSLEGYQPGVYYAIVYGASAFTDVSETTPDYDFSGGTEASDYAILINGPLPKTATPSISPNGGPFIGSKQVVLTCPTAGASIRYTIDGTPPNLSSILYTGAFIVNNTSTIRALAIKNGFTDSSVVSANFSISDPPIVSSPVISPNGGIIIDSKQVELTCSTPDAWIRYTTDGTPPTFESLLYTGPFIVGSTATIKAIAIKNGYADSSVVSANFVKKSGSNVVPAVFLLLSSD